ncbi:MAG: glycosyltransferase [Merismopedia sp. SIO2A8]|nr:glycosyltransferase [Merismopedia sp. SIO2A8]
MKVLHIIPSLSPGLGGPTQVALYLVHVLRTLGIDAEIATTNHDTHGPLPVATHKRVEYVFDTDRQLSVPVWFLPYSSPTLKEFIFSKAITGWLWRNTKQYDLLDNHYLFSYTPTCAAAIARWHGIPYTIRTMGQLTPWALAQSTTKKKLYASLIENRNLKRAAAIHCTSNEEAENVREFGINTPTVTLPLGVAVPPPIPDAPAKLRHAYGLKSETPIILFLSRLHYKKQPEILLKAIQRLTEKQAAHSPPCHVILAGTGEPDYLKTLQDLAQTLGIDHQVTFTGFVTGYDKHLLLQGSTAFALPSHSENFGIAVAEALISGLPVIITPGIQISSEIHNAKAGLMVKADEEAFAIALHQLITQPALQNELRRNGLQFAQTQYSWTAIGQQLATVYQTIVTQHQKRATV